MESGATVFPTASYSFRQKDLITGLSLPNKDCFATLTLRNEGLAMTTFVLENRIVTIFAAFSHSPRKYPASTPR